MKYLKIALTLIALVMTVVVVQPAWADYQFSTNPEYTGLTQALESALSEQQEQGVTPENVQAIADLRFQKYIMETGGKHSTCRNNTTEPLLVYGTKGKKSLATFDQMLYALPAGGETDDDWNCAGLYRPGKVADDQQPATPATALKILPGTRLVASTNPQTNEVELNVSPAKVFKSGEMNWQIPETVENLSAIPLAPVD